jgi:hypothetical protein
MELQASDRDLTAAHNAAASRNSLRNGDRSIVLSAAGIFVAKLSLVEENQEQQFARLRVLLLIECSLCG